MIVVPKILLNLFLTLSVGAGWEIFEVRLIRSGCQHSLRNGGELNTVLMIPSQKKTG